MITTLRQKFGLKFETQSNIKEIENNRNSDQVQMDNILKWLELNNDRLLELIPSFRKPNKLDDCKKSNLKKKKFKYSLNSNILDYLFSIFDSYYFIFPIILHFFKNYFILFYFTVLEYSNMQTIQSATILRVSPSKSSPKKQSQQLTDSPYSCQLCKKVFSNENTLETHLNSAKHKKLAAEARKTPTSPESKSSSSSSSSSNDHQQQPQKTPVSKQSPKQSPKRTNITAPTTTSTSSTPPQTPTTTTTTTTTTQSNISEVQQANFSLSEFRLLKSKGMLEKQQQKAIKLLVVSGKVFAKSYYLKDCFECYSNLLRLLNQPNQPNQQQQQQSKTDVEKMMIHRSWGVISRILFELDISDKRLMSSINVIDLFLESLFAFVPRKPIFDLITSIENHRSTLFSDFWNNDVELAVEKCFLFSASSEQTQTTNNLIQSSALKAIRETLSIISSEQSMHSLTSIERNSKLRIGIALSSVLAKFIEKYPNQLEQIGFLSNSKNDFIECIEILASIYGKLEIFHFQVECWLFLSENVMMMKTNNVVDDHHQRTMKIKGLIENSLKQNLLSENLKAVRSLLKNEKQRQFISPIWIEISNSFMEMNVENLTTLLEEGNMKFQNTDILVLNSLIEILLQQ